MKDYKYVVIVVPIAMTKKCVLVMKNVLLLAGILLGFHFYPDEEGSMFLRNLAEIIQDFTLLRF
jgi:hypothetical protein